MKTNPSWLTSVLANAFEELEDKIPARWLPRLEEVRARRGVIVGEVPELGCGAYGCVLNTLDPSTVLKVTTDSTESEFAAQLASDLVAPIVTEYRLVVRLSEKRHGQPIHLLWREAASNVGKVDEVIGEKAENLVSEQHVIAQEAYNLIYTGESFQKIQPVLEHWLKRCELMATVPDLKPLGLGLVKVYREQHIFFGDIHSGNLGQVERDGQSVWVITDPGHVAVIQS